MKKCEVLEFVKDACDEELETLVNGERFKYWESGERYEGNTVYLRFLTLLKETEEHYYAVVELID